MDPPSTIGMPIASSRMYKVQLKATTDYVKPIKKFLVFGAGAAVTETGFMKAEVLHEKVEREYRVRVENFSFGSPETTEQFGPLPPGFLLDAAKDELTKDGNGKKTYQAFKALKSQFRTTWMKHVRVPKSGENDKDVIDRVCREVWAERRNNELRKKLKDPTATVQECPVSFIPLERATFEAFWKHPLLHRPKSSLEEDDDGIFKRKPSSLAGVMSRRQQRDLKKQKTNNSSNNNNGNAPNKEQMTLAEKNRIELNRQNRIQIAWMLKDTDHEKYLKILDKLANEVTNNNNNDNDNNDNDNNNNNNNNNNSDDSSLTE